MTDNPILAKLRLKSGYRAIVLDAPESYRSVLAEIPSDVDVAVALEGQFDFIHYFVADKTEMERRVPELKRALKSQGLLWVSYPKGKALPTNLNRDIVAQSLKNLGLTAVSQVAINDVWSALRFKHS